MFQEFESTNPTANLRQGDIVRFVRDDLLLRRFGILLTADCDIAHNKFGENYTLAPVVGAQEYVRNVWAHDYLSLRRHKALRDICRLIQDEAPQFRSFKHDDMANVLNNCDDERLIEASNVRSAHQLKKLLAVYRAAQPLQPTDPLSDVRRFVAATQKNPDAAFRNAIENALVQRREEFYFLNYLPDTNEIGYIILLRQIETLPRDLVYKTASEMRFAAANGMKAYRTGRLGERIKHSVIEQFANVFNRVGLPPEFEMERDDAISLLVDEICR